MSTVHIHLFINHAPFFGITFGLLLLIIAMLKNLEEFKKLGLIIMVVSSLLTVPTYFSGENSEEAVEHLPGVSEGIMEEHEDMGKIALGLSGLLGLLSLASIFLKDKNQKIALTSIIVLGLITEGAIAKTANLGGQIRHSEIRAENANNVSNEKEGKEDKKGEDKDEDESSEKEEHEGK